LTFKLRYITLEGSWRIRTQHKQPY